MNSKVAVLVTASLLELAGLALAKDGVIRYSSNIIHENKLYPDRSGQSYTNYHFDPTNLIGNSRNNIRKTPRKQTYPFEGQSEEDPKLFNVGYTISFANSPYGNGQQYNNGRIDDVIVGTRLSNEMPARPASTSSPSSAPSSEEIILNEFLDEKKRKLSGIKPKYYRPLTHGLDTKHLLSLANLSPKTQMKLAELQIDTTTSAPVDPEWKPLSSGVEIYRSNNIYSATNQNYQTNPTGFDHTRALTRSLSFDHSNVVVPQHYQRYRRYYN